MIDMNKSFSMSKVTIVMLLLLVAMVVYCFVYFLPAQTTMSCLNADIAVYNAESSIYREYLTDHSPLEADIESIQAQIDQLNSEAYTNDANVSFEISNAVQRYQISLAAVSIQNVGEFEDYRVLPITLSVSGEMDNLLKFIKHFENNQDGSYLVRGSKFTINGNKISASIDIFLCTPNV